MSNATNGPCPPRSAQCGCDERVYAGFFNVPVTMRATEEGRIIQVADLEPDSMVVHLRCGKCGRPFDSSDDDAQAMLALVTEAARGDAADLLPVLRQVPLQKSAGSSQWVAQRHQVD